MGSVSPESLTGLYLKEICLEVVAVGRHLGILSSPAGVSLLSAYRNPKGAPRAGGWSINTTFNIGACSVLKQAGESVPSS